MSTLYNIVSPVYADIYGDSFKDAVKRFIRLNRALAINDLIIKDQNNHMYAKIKYLENDIRNRVGINIYPTNPIMITKKDGSIVPASIIPSVAPVFPLMNPPTLVGNSGLTMSPVPVVTEDKLDLDENGNPKKKLGLEYAQFGYPGIPPQPYPLSPISTLSPFTGFVNTPNNANTLGIISS
jgi:hypothetical protein